MEFLAEYNFELKGSTSRYLVFLKEYGHISPSSVVYVANEIHGERNQPSASKSFDDFWVGFGALGGTCFQAAIGWDIKTFRQRRHGSQQQINVFAAWPST